MADIFHSFLDFLPLHGSYKLHVVLPSKNLSSTHVYSPSSRIHRLNRRPFHLKLFSRPSAPTPSSIDVVSTHEHSDGSLVFRFGKPGEAASNVQKAEPNVEKKKIEREGIEDNLVVNVLNGDNDGGVKDSCLAEVTDESNSIVIDGKNISIGEKENDLDEKLMKGATEYELPTTASNADLKDSSTQGIDMEYTGDTKEYLNDEQENSSMKSVSQNFDIISTHEHSDGTLIFRFGDLSESASNAQLEESKVEKDIEEEDTEEDRMVTDLNGDDDGGVRDSSLAELEDIPKKSILVSESTEDDNVNGDIVESSGNEVMEMKPTEVSIKSQDIQMTDLVLSSGTALLPHPSKVLTGGEDAYFVTGQTWLGVADGVGQWSFEGTNPGVYAQELIKNCEKLALDCNSNSKCNPAELLKLSVGETQSPGSSTVLLAQLVGQVLQVANIGDSGFIILRHGSVYKRSSPMLHVFHFPLQIERGVDPSNLAELYRIDLEEEDVIILASDGLLDNLYDQEIASEVSKYLAADSKPEEIAEALAAKAQEVGKSVMARSPFADNAQAAGYAGCTGGKLDDITVIVSVVQRQSSSHTM